MLNDEQKVEPTSENGNSTKPPVMGSCFCGEPAVVRAFDTNFCKKHDDELTRSFKARMRMPSGDFDGGGGA